jgi:pimeloyl-ACP methyl ester carboxylesterase
MKTVVSKDGTPIAYWRSGSGTPLVLVHGATDDHTLWTSVSPALQQHGSVYAMDRRGRGRSGDADAYALEREWEDVAAVVDGMLRRLARSPALSAAAELAGQTALVTGGTAGIGFETARLLAQAGASVIITGRDADRGARAAAALSSFITGSTLHADGGGAAA